MITFELGDEFKRQARHLAKKYRSLPNDLRKLQMELMENPTLGDDLGGEIRKVRMAIAAKGKGKSGGARVITYRVIQTQEDTKVTLLTIYDKNEMENISNAFIQSLVKNL